MRQRITAVAGLLALLLALTACGSSGIQDDAPVDQILRDARAAADQAQSVHITGTITQNGQQGDIDLLLTNRGDGKQDITLAGSTISVIKVGRDLYAKGITPNPQSGSEYRKLAPDDPQAAQFAGSLDKKALIGQLLDPAQQLIKAERGTIGEQETLTLKAAQGGGTLALADDAERPYPLQLRNSGQGGALTVTLAEWDRPVTITAPPEA